MKPKTIEDVLELRNQAFFPGGSHEDGKGYWKMNAINIADFALSLHAQLQQEQQAREKLETAAQKLFSIHDEFAQFDAQDRLAEVDATGETPYSYDDDRVQAGERLDIAERELRDSLARPAQADAGEGKAL